MRKITLLQIPYLYFMCSRFILVVFGIFQWFRTPIDRGSFVISGIAVEAGEAGWNSIEINELFKSAADYVGSYNVYKNVIDRNKRYGKQLEDFLLQYPITHYVYDARSYRERESLNYWNAFIDSITVALVLYKYRVIPIVYSTDIADRLWRCQAMTVTSRCGVVVTFVSPKSIEKYIPHNRIVGPSLMPMSSSTIKRLSLMKRQLVAGKQVDNICRFVGSLYEPRTTFLNNFKSTMGDNAEIVGRQLGSARKSEDEYWTLLLSATIIITTADQVEHNNIDLGFVKHLIYRYLEVMAAGSLLLAPAVAGIEKYFKPYVDFIPYDSLEDACKKASQYLSDSNSATMIASNGNQKAISLIKSNAFWVSIDSALGPHSII